MPDNVKVKVGYNDSAVITGLANLRNEISKTNAQIARQQGGLFKAVLGGNLVSDGIKKIAGGVSSAFGAVRDQVVDAFDLSGNAEATRVSLETMIGSADKANKVIEQAVALANKSPYALPEITGGVRSLIAFGEANETAVATLSRIGDVASGVNAPIGEIAEIYGKARVAGTLFAEDINQLTGRGIPIIQEFAKQLGVSEGEVKKLASQGGVTFPMLEQAFHDLTGEGGKFNGMMAKQSGTFKGLLSTLADGWDTVKTKLAAPVMEKLKPLLEKGIGLMDKMAAKAEKVGKTIGDWVDYIQGSFEAGDGFTSLLGDFKIGLVEAANSFLKMMHVGVLTLIGLMQEKNPFSSKADVSKTASEVAKTYLGRGPLAETLQEAYAERDERVKLAANANEERRRRKQAEQDQAADAESERVRTPEEIEAQLSGQAKELGLASDYDKMTPEELALGKTEQPESEKEKEKVRKEAEKRQELLARRDDVLAAIEDTKSSLFQTHSDSMAQIFGGGNAVESINLKQLAKMEQMAKSLAAIEQKIGIPRFTE